MTLARAPADADARVDEHLDPEDEIAFEDAASDGDDAGDDASERSYGSDEDYDGGEDGVRDARGALASDAIDRGRGNEDGRDRGSRVDLFLNARERRRDARGKGDRGRTREMEGTDERED